VVVSYNKHYEVSHLVSPVFTGHGEVFTYLDSSLKLTKAPRQQVQRRFVLFGLGGSGKTQICLRYAQMHRERYLGYSVLSTVTIFLRRRLGIGAFSGSTRAPSTVFSVASHKSPSYYKSMKTSMTSKECLPTHYSRGFLCSTTRMIRTCL
jgi:hypothetical protein